MSCSFLDKFTILEEINSNSKIKTYLAKIEPIIKEIIPNDKEELYRIYQKLQQINNEIYKIIEENDKIYVVLDNKEELMKKIDKIILEENMVKEVEIDGRKAIAKEEILNLFKMEKSMCKITTEIMENNIITNGIATGFFCELNNFPIKYCLFTNNHVIDNIELGKIIKFKYFECKKSLFSTSNNIVNRDIEITQNRKVFTSKELDYTCIELFDSDGIKDFFKIDVNIFTNKESLIDNDIFILQYPKNNDISFSYGRILSLKDNIIKHNASTDKGSSGSPIIKRSENNNYIIGLHSGGYKKKSYNVGTPIDSILNDIKEKYNEINCIYYGNEISLFHDYNLNLYKWNDESKKLYLEAKELNENIFENHTEIFKL